MGREDREIKVLRWLNRIQSEMGCHFIEDKGLTERLWCAKLDGYCAYLTDACASTMDVAWELVRMDRFPEKSWIMAVEQNCGRGQFGRSWGAGVGNLFVTYRVPDDAAAAGPLLPLAIGALIAQELEAQFLVTEIKWPNDILVGRRKAGGILIEQRQNCILAGVGINVRTAPDLSSIPGGYDIDACSLVQFGSSSDAPGLWVSLTRRFKKGLLRLLSAPEDLIKCVEQRLAFKGEWVHFQQGDGESSLVRINGIDRSGGLILTDAREEKIIRSGRIVPRVMR